MSTATLEKSFTPACHVAQLYVAAIDSSGGGNYWRKILNYAPDLF
jgi:hypothetical protein